MVLHSDLHVVPWYKLSPFTFGFNNVLLYGTISIPDTRPITMVFYNHIFYACGKAVDDVFLFFPVLVFFHVVSVAKDPEMKYTKYTVRTNIGQI
jgi:hypothetical protein